MESYVVDGAKLRCTLGTNPSTLSIPKGHGIYLRDKKQANAADHMPIINIGCFGSCMISAPPPACVVATNGKWTNPKSDVYIDKDKAILNTSICFCAVGGVISITDDGQE